MSQDKPDVPPSRSTSPEEDSIRSGSKRPLSALTASSSDDSKSTPTESIARRMRFATTTADDDLITEELPPESPKYSDLLTGWGTSIPTEDTAAARESASPVASMVSSLLMAWGGPASNSDIPPRESESPHTSVSPSAATERPIYVPDSLRRPLQFGTPGGLGR